MLNIKNLPQLKKAIASGNVFVIKEHWRETSIGQRRKANIVQTNGVYTIVLDEPDNERNKVNGGKGTRLQYGKASDWEFIDGKCTLYQNQEHKPENLIMSFVFE